MRALIALVQSNPVAWISLAVSLVVLARTSWVERMRGRVWDVTDEWHLEPTIAFANLSRYPMTIIDVGLASPRPWRRQKFRAAKEEAFRLKVKLPLSVPPFGYVEVPFEIDGRTGMPNGSVYFVQTAARSCPFYQPRRDTWFRF